MSATDPARRLLGFETSPDDPHSLLGLPPGDHEPEAVIEALRTRVTQVADHPEANTLEADEVRLALHAAAARLLDPAWKGGTRPGAMPASIEASIARTLAMAGGWNKDSMRRLTMLARAQGVEGETLVRHLGGLTHAPQDRPTTQASRAATPRDPDAPTVDSPLPEQIDPASGAVKAVLAFVGVGLVGLLLLGWGAVVLFNKPQPAPTPVAPGPGPTTPIAATKPTEVFPAPQRQPDPPKPRVVDPESGGRVGDFTDLIREVSAAARAFGIDPQAAFARYETAAAAMGREWPRAGRDGVVAGSGSVLEFIYASANDPEFGPRAIDAISRGGGSTSATERLEPDGIAPAAWSAGMLTRLLRERDLPSAVRERVRERFTGIFTASGGPSDASFQSGAIAVLSTMPPRLLLPATPYEDADAKRAAEGWSTWLAAVTAVDASDERLRETLTVQALERLLTEAAEPMASRPVFDGVTQLTTSLRWRKGDESRRALLRWFVTPSVSAVDLHAVTSALATKTSAEGVDYTMVLSLAGGDSQRAELRDRYAAVWGVTQTASRSELVEQWLKAATERLAAESDAPVEPPLDLAAAVNLARLNECAAMLWAGETAGVGDILDLDPMAAPNEADAAKGHAPALGIPELTAVSSTWAVRYLAAGQAIPPRREILAQVNAVLSPPEADIIAEEAVRGSPVQVRQDARALVQKFSAHPAIVNALLEQASIMPATRENTELLRIVTGAPIPVPRDPGWRVAVRRGLVERLLDVLADQAAFGFVDISSADLAESYRGRLIRAGQTRTRGDGSAANVEDSARIYRSRLRQEAEVLLTTGRETMGLAELDSRRSARLGVASGRIQLFAAEQVGAAEILAYITTLEKPDAVPSVAASLRTLDDRRRGSRHIFQQLRAAERAMLAIWVERFGGPPA